MLNTINLHVLSGISLIQFEVLILIELTAILTGEISHICFIFNITLSYINNYVWYIISQARMLVCSIFGNRARHCLYVLIERLIGSVI